MQYTTKGAFRAKTGPFRAPGGPERPDTRSTKCVVTMSPTLAGQSGSVLAAVGDGVDHSGFFKLLADLDVDPFPS